MGGGDLNTKKSWHPHTMKNQERVWKAEQQEAAEKRKLVELEQEIRHERDREELKDLARKSGTIATSSDPDKKLEWMYKQSKVNREEYLLGRQIDRTFEQEQHVDQTASSAKNHVEHECIPFSIRQYKGLDTSEQVDISRKLAEDPLMLIQQKELESRRKLLENPVKLKELHKLLKEEQDAKADKKTKKTKKKKSKKSKSKKSKRATTPSGSEDSDDDDLDRKLSKKYKNFQNNMEGDDSQEMNLDKLLSMKYNKLSKELDKMTTKKKKKKERDSSTSEDDGRRRKEEKRRDNDGSSRDDMQMRYRDQRMHRSRSMEKVRRLSPKRSRRESRSPMRPRQRSRSRDRRRQSVERNRARKRQSTESSDERQRSRSRDKKRRSVERTRGRKSKSPDDRQRSRSRDKKQRSVERKRERNRQNSESSDERQNSRSRDKRARSGERRRERKRQNSESSDERYKRRNPSPPKRRKLSPSPDRQKKAKSKTPESSSSSDSSSSSSAKNTPEQRRIAQDSEGEEIVLKQKAFGLVTADGQQLAIKDKNSYKKPDVKPPPSKSEIAAVASKRPATSKKLSEEEVAKRLREMSDNVQWREKDRQKTIKNYTEEEKRQKERDEGKQFDHDFINKELHKATSKETVEHRIKSNLNNIQRSGRAMDANFARR